MTVRILASILLLSLLVAACATRWREDASAVTLRCPSSEVVISDPTSGAINNTWRAQCGGKVYLCSVAADADPYAAPSCKEIGPAPVAESPAPAPSIRKEPAPSAAASSISPTEPAAAPAPSDLESKLQILKRAHEQGLITDAEYESKRRALLDAF